MGCDIKHDTCIYHSDNYPLDINYAKEAPRKGTNQTKRQKSFSNLLIVVDKIPKNKNIKTLLIKRKNIKTFVASTYYQLDWKKK
jgi:hypothetical protein